MKRVNRLKNRRVVITGATSGIGRATAECLAEAGAELFITGRRSSRLEAVQRDLTEQYDAHISSFDFDIRDRGQCREFVDSLDQPVDILINNAGLAAGKDPVDRAHFDDWDRMIDTNVKGLLTLTRLLTPQMKKRNHGHILNIGSIAGHEAYAGGVVYCATKHAVHAITQATKKDLHGTNIRVSEVSPGLVETEFSNVRFKGDDEMADRVYQGMQPLTAMDIAEIVFFTLNRPAHVNIMDTVVLPVQQSASTMVHRSS